MNLHVAQSTQAQAECRQILHIKNNAVNGGTNKAVFGAVQDTMCGLNLMTRPDAMVPVELLMDCAMYQRYNYRELHEILPPKETRASLVPAWWALDLIFPRDFCYHCDGVVIVDGRIQPGSAPFTSKHAGNGSGSINYVLSIDYGNAASVEWLSDAGRTAYIALTQWHGFSVSLSDMHISEAVTREAQANIRAACDDAETRGTDREQLESLSSAMLAASEALDRTAFTHPDNALHTMITSGAKGSRLNAQQLMVAVGQQVIGSGRPPLDSNGRTMSCFRPGGIDARNTQGRGMICQSYCHALGPVENFFHSAAARKGLAETVRVLRVFVFCVCVFSSCTWIAFCKRLLECAIRLCVRQHHVCHSTVRPPTQHVRIVYTCACIGHIFVVPTTVQNSRAVPARRDTRSASSKRPTRMSLHSTTARFATARTASSCFAIWMACRRHTSNNSSRGNC